ncbi:MAG: hypothetical protein K5979_01030 [Ruminococcus sp.]|nr:hypothetical protein [Ruminococcus sp.]
MFKKTVLYFIIALIVSAFAAGRMQSEEIKMKPGFCADVCAHDNWIYGIDHDALNHKACVYRVDESGRNLIRISLDLQRNNLVFHYDTLYYDTNDGELYYHVSVFNASSGLLTSEMVYRCDFDSCKAEKAWNVPLDDQPRNTSYMLTYRISDNTLEYLTMKSDGYSVMNLKADDEVCCVRQIRCADESTLSSFCFDNSGRLCAFSYAAGMYHESADSMFEPVSGEKNVWGGYIDPVMCMDDSLTWFDVSRSTLLTFRIPDGKVSEMQLPQEFLVTVDSGTEEYKIDHTMFTSLGAADDGYAVYAELPEESRTAEDKERFRFGVGVFRNGTVDLLSVLYVSSKDAKFIYVKSLLFYMGIALIVGLVLLAVYLMVQKYGFIPLQLEMAFFGLLLLCPSLIIMSRMLSGVMRGVYKANYDDMRDNLKESIFAELDILIDQDENFNELTPYTPEFYEKLGRIMPDEVQVINPATDEGTFVPYFLFHIVNQENELEILYNKGEIEHVPSSCLYHNSYLDKNKKDKADFVKVQEKKTDLKSKQYDTAGKWNTALYYYENKEHGVCGVLEIGINDDLTSWKQKQAVKKAVVIALTVFLLMTALILIYLSASLAPVNKLGLQVSRGSIDLPKNQKWSREIRQIWELLYVLINSGMQKKEELERNNREHSRFFAEKLTALLGKQDLTEIDTDTRRQCRLQIVHTVFRETNLEKLPELTAVLTSMCRNKGGILLSMDMYHAEWIFKAESGDCIGAAREIIWFAKKYGTECGVGLGNGICNLYIRGAEWSAEAALSGEEAEQSAILAERAAQQGGICLMTAAAAALAGGTQVRKITEDGTFLLLCADTNEAKTSIIIG